MRKYLAALTIALLSGACGELSGPANDRDAQILEDFAALGYNAMQVGHADAGDDLMARLGRLPASQALTADQIARIGALVQTFETANSADRTALAAIKEQAGAARNAGKTPAEVEAILTAGAATRARLQQAEAGLRDAVMSLLTPAQRAALSGREPKAPRPCVLTDAQRTEISALLAAFEQTNSANIALIRSAHERAAAAKAAGATREAIDAILAEGRAAAERTNAARATLQTAIAAVYTPAQTAAGCATKVGGSRDKG
jgi:Spy/CpxP family protein refolding chaperone